MALGSGTVALFLLLIPGLVYRALIYQGAIILRPFFAANALYSTVAVLFYSTAVYILTFLLWAGGSWAAMRCGQVLPQLVMTDGHLALRAGLRDMPLTGYLVAHPWAMPMLVAAPCLVALGLAWATQRLSFRLGALARLMYGPLGEMYLRNRDAIVTCSILSRLGHDHAKILYQGLPIEISLRPNNSIEHIVLRAPSRASLLMPAARSAARVGPARSIAPDDGRDLLLIEGAQIENVHFSWYRASALP